MPDAAAWDHRGGKAPSRQTLPAQSMTVRSILKHGRNLAHYDPGDCSLRACKLSGHATFYGREVGWSVFHPVDLWINPHWAAFVRVFFEGAKKIPITNDQGPRNDQCANPTLRGIRLITSAATGCRFPSPVRVRTPTEAVRGSCGTRSAEWGVRGRLSGHSPRSAAQNAAKVMEFFAPFCGILRHSSLICAYFENFFYFSHPQISRAGFSWLGTGRQDASPPRQAGRPPLRLRFRVRFILGRWRAG